MKKRTMKRILAITLSMAMVFGMTACGAKEETAAPTEESAEGEVIELELWLAGTEQDNHYKAIPAAVDAFNEANDNINVKVVLGGPVEEYSKKITMMAETNELPDLFLNGMGGVEGFLEGGVLLDITDYMANDPEWSSYKPVEGAFWNMERMQNGRRSGIPMNAAVQGWFFNEDLFKEQGIEIPTTFAELIEAIKTFKAAGITPIAHGAVDTWSVWGYYAIFNQYGMAEVGEKIKNGETTWSESMVEPFRRIKEMADAGAYPEGVSAMTHSQAKAAFLNGECPIFSVGSWETEALSTEMKGTLKFRFNFLDMPNTTYEQDTGLKSIDWLIFASDSLNESDAKREAGLKFLKYMCSPEASKILVENGYSFPAWDCGDITEIEGVTPVTLNMYENLNNETLASIESYNYVSGNLSTAFWSAVNSVITGDIKPEEAAQQMDDNWALMQ